MTKIPIAKEGLVFIVPALILMIVFGALGVPALAFLFLLLFCFFLFFYRNPNRAGVCGEDELLCPADGRVMGVDDIIEEEFTGETMRRVSIFMSVSDVHVNRVPCAGVITGISHRDGRYGLAFKKAVERVNERNFVLLQREEERFVLVQIAGFLARRIICYVKEMEKVGRGDAFGMIAFGSRVDLYMPLAYEARVAPGDKVKSGLTVIAQRRGSK